MKNNGYPAEDPRDLASRVNPIAGKRCAFPGNLALLPDKPAGGVLALSLFLMLTANAFCQDAAPATEPAAATNAAAGDEKPLRDPFLPLDFVPRGAVPVVPATPTEAGTVEDVPVTPVTPVTPDTPVAPVAIKWPALKLKGLIKSPDGKYVALIDGGVGMVESRRIVRKKIDGIEFSWQIGDITEKGVKIKQLEARPIR